MLAYPAQPGQQLGRCIDELLRWAWRLPDKPIGPRRLLQDPTCLHEDTEQVPDKGQQLYGDHYCSKKMPAVSRAAQHSQCTMEFAFANKNAIWVQEGNIPRCIASAAQEQSKGAAQRGHISHSRQGLHKLIKAERQRRDQAEICKVQR